MAEETNHTYEAMFLVEAGAAENWEGVLGAINKIMQRAQAEVINIRKWDERRLSYAVSGHRRGTYILSYFRARPEAIQSIERDVQLDETILRVLILRADRIPQEIIEAPTPYGSAKQQKEPEADVSAALESQKEADFEEVDYDSLDLESTGVDEEYPPSEGVEDDEGAVPDIIESLTEPESKGDKKEKTKTDNPEERDQDPD
ncbi:MAG: hypothetical protein AMJ79_13025 [Phycisphaerae bacterium SM23_30]|nr:MAG: hypothetical protein AMJ79_13025 [Phycisphaerae bacterium SM23_30]